MYFGSFWKQLVTYLIVWSFSNTTLFLKSVNCLNFLFEPILSLIRWDLLKKYFDSCSYFRFWTDPTEYENPKTNHNSILRDCHIFFCIVILLGLIVHWKLKHNDCIINQYIFLYNAFWIYKLKGVNLWAYTSNLGSLKICKIIYE